MSSLKALGYFVFRLKEVKETEEYLLYDSDLNSYNQYSHKRLISILVKQIDSDNKISWDELADIVYGENKKKKVEAFSLIESIVYNDYVLIDNISYKPTDNLTFKEDNKIFFNIYNKSKLLKNIDELESNPFPNIKKVVNNLVGNNKDEYNYFCKWLAWKIKNPLLRLPTAIILQGEHGTGKTKFCELVLKPIFEKGFCEIGQADINKEYNDYMLGKELIVANEVIHNDNKLLVPDKLKNYVTDDYVSINRKFKDTTYQRNYSQWIFVTNNKVPLKIERGDRRYSVFKSKKLKNGFKIIGDLIINHKEELEGFLYYLNNLELDYEEVATPLNNEAKRDIIKHSNTSIDDFLDYIKESGGFESIKNFVDDSVYAIRQQDKAISIDTSVLYKAYIVYCEKYKIIYRFSRTSFTRNLKSIGFESIFVRDKDRTIRAILIKNGWENYL